MIKNLCQKIRITISLTFFPLLLVAQTAPDDQQIFDKMVGLLNHNPSVQIAAGDWLVAQRDLSLIPAFVDAMYLTDFPRELLWALKDFPGQWFQGGWPQWMEWMGQQDIKPHPAYIEYKRVLLGNIDPVFAEFLDPKWTLKIRPDEIVWGGVKKDGIPALDNPKMISAAEAVYLKDKDEIYGISLNGEHHAYPLRIINWHEMVNVTIGGEALSLTYCTLCGSAIPYFGKINQHLTLTFGSSGLLYRSNKLMYDRQTHSLWSSLEGRPVSGPLADNNLRLKAHYVVRTTWKEWRSRHPDTRVLDIDTGYERDYNKGAYNDYFKSSKTMFPITWQDKRLKAKDWIYGIHLNGASRAYPLKRLKKFPLLQESFQDSNLVILFNNKNYEVRVYLAGQEVFSDINRDGVLVDNLGRHWEVREERLLQVDQQLTLPRLPGHLAFWFGWYSFYQNTSLWSP